MSDPRQMPTDQPPVHVHDAPEHSRYEARLGDAPELAAVIGYERFDGHMALLSTEVQEGFEGRGIGSRLVRAVFADARERGLKIVPVCPFIVRWLERHPEEHDVLLHPLDEPEPPDPDGGEETA